MTPVSIDVIILSYAFNDRLRQITTNCVDSIMASENDTDIIFNIIVIESYKVQGNFQYRYTKTIYPSQPFGYHRYMNIGIDMTNAPFVCLCNNDLIFHRGWASEMLNSLDQFPYLVSLSPVSSILHPYIGIPINSGMRLGYRIGVELTGWCLFVRRSIFQIVGKLDENYIFMGADHDYANLLAVLNLNHALITSSIVDHFDSTTLLTQPKDRQDYLKLVDYHYQKWGHRILSIDPEVSNN